MVPSPTFLSRCSWARDDVESYFCFPYAGLLPKTELEDAHENGFVRPIRSGHLPHTRSWPKKYADWADPDPQAIGKWKAFDDVWDPFCEATLVGSPELQDFLKNNWPEQLHPAIRCLLVHSFTVFNQSTQHTARKRKRTGSLTCSVHRHIRQVVGNVLCT